MLSVVRRLAEMGYQIEPDALEMICSTSEDHAGLLDRLVGRLDLSTVVVGADHVRACLTQPASSSRIMPSEVNLQDLPLESSGLLDPPTSRHMQSCHGCGAIMPESNLDYDRDVPDLPGRPRDAHDSDASAPVEVICDITGQSTCQGRYSDFVHYFRDRYSRLKEMLSHRMNSRPIESLGKNTAGREVSVIGMVMDIRATGKGHRVVELEDPTGMVTVLFQKDAPLYEQSLQLVTDEVVGVSGTSDGAGRIFASNLVWPDLQAQSSPLCPGEGGAILLSDLHVGSRYFLQEAWNRFTSWLCGEMEDPSGLAEGVRYLVIAGDVVDGIGVYPGQEQDLAIKDIYDQYELAAECLRAIPSGLRIILAPGNHDMVRQAEPQPSLPREIQALFPPHVTFVGNPSYVSLGKVSSLIYHGRSIDDLVMKVPGLSYQEPEKAMVEMLRRRHLCPIYGQRVSIAPEGQDHYVISRPPAILHCGHVHIFGATRYKGVLAVNSGTWQSQTDFQKKMNIQPTPAIAANVDLATMKVRKLLFA
ncbi:MAG: DNA polymerase II small subunit [Methanosaeta sp. PtaB.Bin039]|nr:MAG: DNA polymerase II small subunit [Methanosaeta sp. PtaB.Bin039]OPY46613.1 MAG: DNA polymerase II small subunit [Methanosaeta sp. PtaU1.Bin028]HOT06101.1 DNA-directed DNA polymerase II small subunit [Methanotrichaceae archaeon]HQF16249.1 DNA-directed DNA polymerase II small subunit [Methanotrichaceae archaeon]HQI90021.1 DNA-directed DNA polymerase II small subunit [Methanotrichaceae archaeon]